MRYQKRFNVEELRTWTSKGVAHNLPAEDRPSILPARYALIPCSRHPIRRACAVLVSRSSRALGPPGIATRLRQTLIVTEGLGRVQHWGGPIEEIGPGDVIWFEPAEKQWHGAQASMAMTRIAIQEQLAGLTVDWMEQESSDQYQG
jgi:hypothetical protein